MKHLPMLLLLACVVTAPIRGQTKLDLAKLPPAAKGTIDFARDIQPLFAKRCYECHGEKKQRGGLRLDERKAAFEGSNSGAVLVPGNVAKSKLLHVVAGLDPDSQMPPKERPQLTRAEIAVLRAWIEQGANWPEAAGTTTKKTASDHWAFQPIHPPTLPAVKNQAWVKNDIDRFVLARLEKERIAPSPEADRNTYIRRLYLDLLGLPPTPADVHRFGEDSDPMAYEKLVERVLASPHYGERWGRHWLDLARYADSDGYEQDRPRPYAFRYRDWVIAALNRDLPLDQFIIEQLAGDLLPNATLEQKTATGFHRNTLTNREGGTDKEQFRVEAVMDRVSTTFKVFFGLTMNCAQCHDHKYDPISTREFYQVFAFFNSDDEIDVPSPLPDDVLVYTKEKAANDKRIAALRKDLDAKLLAWEKALKDDERSKLPANIVAILNVSAKDRSEIQAKDLTAYLAKNDAKIGEVNKMINELARKAPTQAFVPTLGLGKGRKTHVLLRGDFLRPGVEVSRGTPAVLHPLHAQGTPTRLDLARWIVAPDNPLTARVIANWVWHHYFGRGIVPTLEDFGAQGEKPSHPDLLDYLASRLFRHDWSLKALHRDIVLSATYRQSSKARPELTQRDPLNVLLSRQNRIRFEAEILRDSALAVSGLLNPTIGGPSVKPPQPPGISELTYANAARWVESKGRDRYRRGMYTWFQRTSPYPMLMTFDAPDSNLCCVRRERTNTPLQSLTLLNDAAFVECFQGLARRIVTEKKSLEDRLVYAFELTLARTPTAEESSAVRTLYEDLLEGARKNSAGVLKLIGSYAVPGVPMEETAAWIGIARTLVNLDEFVTRE
jgi:mono/diheme cytochrome c family protein